MDGAPESRRQSTAGSSTHAMVPAVAGGAPNPASTMTAATSTPAPKRRTATTTPPCSPGRAAPRTGRARGASRILRAQRPSRPWGAGPFRWKIRRRPAVAPAMTRTLEPTVDVRRAADRPRTRIDWLDSQHSFSFGSHYDPRNTHHGLLLVNNDDVVRAGAGFETHPHRDMEIVTSVLRGALVHQASEGTRGVTCPGLGGGMSAGRGVLPSGKNDAWRFGPDRPPDEPVPFVQMWVLPDE